MATRFRHLSPTLCRVALFCLCASPLHATETPEPDAELAQPVSNAARVRLDKARGSVVQIRGFFGDAQSDAFHGSGFAVSSDGLIVTNYHVVSEAVLYPKQYRLEYLTPDGQSGALAVHSIDIENDLAVVKADDLTLPPLKPRVQIPGKGERAYSIGFPLNLGLTITEGVANGLVENTREQRIHYSGAMNGGMSGGPALDASGAVYGVNVSVVMGRQSVSFVVPAKHIAPLLARAATPLKASAARDLVAAQLLSHQQKLFAAIPNDMATQSTGGFTVPAKIAPNIECSSDGSTDSKLRVQAVTCGARMGVYIERGLYAGDLRFQHRVLESDTLHPWQFARQLNAFAATMGVGGADKHVAAFSCHDAMTALNGFDARVSTCVRQYRMFAGLYDIAVVVTSQPQGRSAVVSQLELRGVAFEHGLAFAKRFLEAMQWNP